MNKLSKVLMVVLIILIISLSIVSISYFKTKKVAKENLELYLNSEKKITLLLKNYPELQDVDIESLE